MAEDPRNSLLGKIAAYTEILSTDPRSTIFVSLSEAYRKMGLLDDAYAVAVKGLEQLPDYAPGHVVLARVRCQKGDLPGSRESFSRALELEPDSLAALVGFSRLYLLQDQMAEARVLLLRARELSPADPVINKLLLGLPEPVPEETNEPSVAAETELPPAEDTSAASPEPLISPTLAELYLKQGMTDKALELYRELLQRDPDNLDLRRRIRDLESPPSDSEVAPAFVVEAESQGAEEAAAAESDLSDATDQRRESSVLGQLHRLLDAIEKRRGDVQGSA